MREASALQGPSLIEEKLVSACTCACAWEKVV